MLLLNNSMMVIRKPLVNGESTSFELVEDRDMYRAGF